MTTSAVKIRNFKRQFSGFTLLEIIFALSLIGLMVTIAFVSYKPDGANQKMTKAAVELESLSARGHTMAVLHQKPFWLEFRQDRVVLRGAELTTVRTSPIEFERDGDLFEEDVVQTSRAIDYEAYVYPEDLTLFVRRWGAGLNEWFRQEKDEDAPFIWRFESTGLCEPISLRMVVEESWIELEMDPLTGRVMDEQSEIYD
ncbi:MAG: type II secretion system protein [Verrucomicrobiota bacterium]